MFTKRRGSSGACLPVGRVRAQDSYPSSADRGSTVKGESFLQ